MEDRLQKFARLTEIGSFTKAAKMLHISQPALSIAVDKLEQELGTELLIRGHRKLELTDAGRAAYAAALEHKDSTDHLRVEIGRILKRRPTIAIGMTDSVAAIVCATAAFETLEAAADVTVVVNNSRYLRAALENRKLDAAFVIDDEGDHPTLVTEPFVVEELIAVCHPDMAREVVAELGSGKLHHFISYDRPSITYRHIHQALQSKSIKVQVGLFSTSPAVMLDLSIRGKGVATLPRLLVQPYIDSGKLTAVLHQDTILVIERPIHIARLRTKKHTPVLETFLNTVKP